MKFKAKFFAALAGVVLLAGYAVAQSISVPIATNLNPNDLIQVIPRGIPTAASSYVVPSEITAQSAYYKSVPLTLFTFTAGDNVTNVSFNPAGTLAGGYVTLNANPNDGQKTCFFSSAAITAFYVAANSGQSINNAINGTTLSANTGACYLYGLSNATWDRM